MKPSKTAIKKTISDWAEIVLGRNETLLSGLADAVYDGLATEYPELFADSGLYETKDAELAERLRQKCQSPIERQLADALADAPIDLWAISAQEEIRDGDKLLCRPDFSVTIGEPDEGGQRIAIFCDGHDYHERTKEQAARDRNIDRQLQALGISVLRFTGSEIHRDPHGCAYAVARMAWKLKHKR